MFTHTMTQFYLDTAVPLAVLAVLRAVLMLLGIVISTVTDLLWSRMRAPRFQEDAPIDISNGVYDGPVAAAVVEVEAVEVVFEVVETVHEMLVPFTVTVCFEPVARETDELHKAISAIQTSCRIKDLIVTLKKLSHKSVLGVMDSRMLLNKEFVHQSTPSDTPLHTRHCL